MIEFKGTSQNAVDAYAAAAAHRDNTEIDNVYYPDMITVEQTDWGKFQINSYEESLPFHAICEYLEDDLWKIQLGTGETFIVLDTDGTFSVVENQ